MINNKKAVLELDEKRFVSFYWETNSETIDVFVEDFIQRNYTYSLSVARNFWDTLVLSGYKRRI